MNLKFFSLIVFFLFISFTVADVISVNSGGATGILINPATELEGFFSQANQAPVTTNVILSSSSGQNSTNDNLTVTFTSTDADGDNITNITDWRVGGNSIAVLNMPFDKAVEDLVIGAVRDYSTYQNNGTLGGGVQADAPAWNSSCEVGGCYTFNGVSDYINISDSASLDPTNAITISAWIRSFGSTGTYQEIVSKYYTQYELYLFTGTNKLAFQTNNATGSCRAYAGNSLADNSWHYVVFTFNESASQKHKLYVDGVSQSLTFADGNDNCNSAGLQSGSHDVDIGQRSGGGLPFNGSIDEVQIYNRALSPAQIEENYVEGLAHHHVDNLMSSETSKGDTWQVAVTPDDKIIDGNTVLSNSLGVSDLAPANPTGVSLVSLNGRNESNTDLQCSAYISDADNSQFTVDVNWFKNGTSTLNQTFPNQNNATTFSTLLGSGNLSLGDTWYCSVRSYDGSKYSQWENSNNLTIIDITPPNVTIISPNQTNYTTLNVDFNVSATDNENVSTCLYSLDYAANVTMNRLNDTYFWYAPSLGPGPHNVTFYCNDTSGNWGTNSTNFTIENSAAISILLSDNLSTGVVWNVVSLPVHYLDAIGNNLNSSTSYYINVSATNTLVDLYVKASGDLTDAALDTLGLGNETYAVNTTDPTVSNSSKNTMTTNYTLIGDGLGDNSILYMKFYLDAPSSQPAGVYTNNLDFVAVRHGQSPH